MSPQTRRGKAAPASHRKSSSRGTSAATRKPAAAVKAGEEDQLDETQLEDAARVPVRPRRRARGLARLRRTSGYRYFSDALGAYVPLIIAFVVVFGAVWGWISFGPHPPTAKDNWQQIQSTWLPKVQTDRQKIAATKNDYTSQMVAYSALSTDLTGWSTDLTNIASWDSSTATPDPSSGSATPNYDLVQAFINALQQQASNISYLTGSTSGSDIDTATTMVRAGDTGLESAYEAAYRKIMGSAPPSTLNSNPTLSVPSLGICPASSPSGTPGTSPSPGASGTPGPSPSLQLCVPPTPSLPSGPAGSAG